MKPLYILCVLIIGMALVAHAAHQLIKGVPLWSPFSHS